MTEDERLAEAQRLFSEYQQTHRARQIIILAFQRQYQMLLAKYFIERYQTD